MKKTVTGYTIFLLVLLTVGLLAQNPVSIQQLGRSTTVTTTLPVSGSVTANAGTNLNTSALALDSNITTLDTDVKANITLHAGTNVIGHIIADTGSTTAVTGNVATTAADGSNVLLGSKADAKSTATDTTAISAMQVWKQISASVQAPPSQAVTNGGTFPTQSAITAASGSIASGAIASGAIASGAVASGAVASGAYAAGAFAAQSFTVGAIPPASGVIRQGGTSAMTGTTSTQVIASVASNNLYISSCSINNTHATVDTLVDLQDGSGGTVLWVFTAPHGYGGESHTFSTPLKVTTQGNALFAVNETTGASTKVFCQGFSSTVSY